MQFVHYPFSAEHLPQTEQKITLIVDCLLLSTHTINIPKMSVNKAKQAIIYALEDKLLQTVDELSIFSEKENDGTWSVIVIESETLLNIKQEINENAINCLAVVPEFMCLPMVEDKISYIEQDDSVLFRISKFSGGKINKKLFFQYHQEADLQLSELGEHYAAFDFLKVNLWQKYGKYLKQFKVSIALLASVFTLNLVALTLENQQFSKQLETITAQNKALFQNIFPDITQIVDLPVQLEQRLTKVDKWQRSLDKGLLLAMSKHKFDNKTQSIEFKNNKLQVRK